MNVDAIMPRIPANWDVDLITESFAVCRTQQGISLLLNDEVQALRLSQVDAMLLALSLRRLTKQGL